MLNCKKPCLKNRYETFDPDKFHDECGVYGVYSSKEDNLDVGALSYYGLFALQHRGQESAGITVSTEEGLKCHKDMGLVTDIFGKKVLETLKGKAAIGHVRYSTAGESTAVNSQPLVGACKLGGLSIAHNGNIVNADVMKEILEDTGCIFHTTIDSEVVLNLIARSAAKGMRRAVVDTIQAMKGSYGMVILTENELIAIRDPHGIRPLCLGKIKNSYVVASESCALDATGAEFVRDVEPGEILIINDNGVESLSFAEKSERATCSFEYVYFARPDTTMDGINVNSSRIEAGKKLFEECPVEADLVVGVPDSGLSSAVGYSKASGIPFEIGLMKNKYVARTFIAPTQELRERAVSLKLTALRDIIEGKRIILIDDSIVRGTTSKRLVTLLRQAGAKEVHFRSSSPVVKYPCYFGIDTAYRDELIGANLDVNEIAKEIGADSLGYLSIEGLLDCLGKKQGFCLGCFNGFYPISAPVKVSSEK
ncbi:amidophosphoribosyltransferase [Clostridium collagenovorans DSM 3089]|uniref:Amidophosphoribosyltransferase n=1 Tax=Clostridium collagenovorans DSM 3089 TaxID=1121306 RepID=A0A1M5SC41_9CLOT|nr:amidophosphoribosyltransferase [Clostridium collagenovorans]SHH36182.1 amidophosphoribosyltransferase [Clostridium collagenovorans DSM 3089]